MVDPSTFNTITHEILGGRGEGGHCDAAGLSSTDPYVHAAGLLINFNVPKLMDGVKRLVNPRAS
jgi:hypothetical protein